MSDPKAGGAEHSAGRRPVIAVFTSHWLAMLGLGLVLTAVVAWLCLLPARLRQGQDNPYIGIAIAAVGIVLLAGVVLAPIGLYLGRRRLSQRVAATLSDRKTAWFRFLVFLGVVSLFNVLIASQMTLRVVHHMESRQFCLSCHTHVPEERSFDQGPHAGILCVDCHVGDGTLGLIKSKLQGTQQLRRC